jgi:hypothetical protein
LFWGPELAVEESFGAQRAGIIAWKFALWTPFIRNSRTADVQECRFERDFGTFSLENVDLYYVLDASIAGKGLF